MTKRKSKYYDKGFEDGKKQAYREFTKPCKWGMPVGRNSLFILDYPIRISLIGLQDKDVFLTGTEDKVVIHIPRIEEDK